MSDSSGTPWTVTCLAPLFMGFPRQEYWNGLSFPSLGDLSNPGIKPVSPALTGRFFTSPTWGLFISKTHMTSDRKGRRYILNFFLTVEKQAVKAVLGQENTSPWPDDRAFMLVNPGRSFDNRG